MKNYCDWSRREGSERLPRGRRRMCKANSIPVHDSVSSRSLSQISPTSCSVTSPRTNLLLPRASTRDVGNSSPRSRALLPISLEPVTTFLQLLFTPPASSHGRANTIGTRHQAIHHPDESALSRAYYYPSYIYPLRPAKCCAGTSHTRPSPPPP